MKSVSRKYVRGICEEYKENERMFEVLENKDLKFYEIAFEDQESFLSLIWQDIPETSVISGGDSRILKDVIKRKTERNYSFKNLVKISNWFRKCIILDREFDLNKFGYLFIVPANDCEKEQSPKGTFYIFEGQHKSVVYADRIIDGKIEYKKINGILIVPRID